MPEEDSNKGRVAVVAAGLLLLALLLCWWSFGPHSGGSVVTGQVTLNNEPLTGAQVIFLGEEENNQGNLLAVTDEEGYYRLLGQAGVIPPGKYKVVVTKMALKDGTRPEGRTLEQARRQGLLQNVLPKAYEDRATTPLDVNIGAGSMKIDLALAGGKKAGAR